jgi:hypothetical protein
MVGIKGTQQLEIGDNLVVKNIRFALLIESACLVSLQLELEASQWQ